MSGCLVQNTVQSLARCILDVLTPQQFLGETDHLVHMLCRLLKSTKDYELRIYDVYPFATTPYERRDEGFLALGSYMEGRNSESARMNLTQPIVMRYEPATVSTVLTPKP